MSIIRFDINKGIYLFERFGLDSVIHSHPIIEIVFATKGVFDLETHNHKFDQLTFAIIAPNVNHQLQSDHCHLQLLMFESYNTLFDDFLSRLGIILKNGIFTDSTSNRAVLLNQFLRFFEDNDLRRVKDNRVQQCMNILASDHLDYYEMMKILKSKIHLSESRLSHIFKQVVGVSLKKYLIWCKLKKTIDLVRTEQLNLVEASLLGGFYDQSHFSKSFKEMFGISPSKEYNSRTLQF